MGKKKKLDSKGGYDPPNPPSRSATAERYVEIRPTFVSRLPMHFKTILNEWILTNNLFSLKYE